jgi:AhpD family alkylhydroperoxidase
MKSAQRKRRFTFFGFIFSLSNALLRLPRLLIALIHPATSRALREEVMLGCTSVNACRYCDWVHTRLALKHVVDVTALNQFLGSHDDSLLPHSDAVAVLFSQHVAESRTNASAHSKNRLKQNFSFWQRTEILAYLYAIYFANVSGNTFDALLSRLGGRPLEGSSWLTALAVSLIGFPILVPIMLYARKDRSVDFTSQ